MDTLFSRRGWIGLGTLALPLAAAPAPPVGAVVPAGFPSQPPDMVKEMVSVSHGNVKRVRELVEAHPSLAKAAWDWGFGDWESALGAASHVGNREIAEYLISKGARPTLFSAAMLGHLEVVKAFVTAQPGVQRIAGPHSISLLAHAKNGGPAAAEVYRYLESLGDAGSPQRAPLSEAEMNLLKGTYEFGDGAADRIEITVAQGGLMFTRIGTTSRGLVHLGDHVFHPAGASAVQVRFSEAAEKRLLTVHDPDLVLTARKL